MTMATTRSTATTPIKIPSTGFNSNGTGVPRTQKMYHWRKYNSKVRKTVISNYAKKLLETYYKNLVKLYILYGIVVELWELKNAKKYNILDEILSHLVFIVA